MEKNSIKYMSKLARLAITPQEEESLEKDISDILNYIDKLNKLEIADDEVKDLTNKNISRDDLKKDFDDQDILIKNFSQKEGRFLKVRPIL